MGAAVFQEVVMLDIVMVWVEQQKRMHNEKFVAVGFGLLISSPMNIILKKYHDSIIQGCAPWFSQEKKVLISKLRFFPSETTDFLEFLKEAFFKLLEWQKYKYFFWVTKKVDKNK